MKGLRAQLGEITENGEPDSHPQLINELQAEHSHGIEVIAPMAPIQRYTCAVHAFDLVENEEYEGIVLGSPANVFASLAFVQRLIDRGVLKKVAEPLAGTLVVYRKDGAVKHIGKMISPSRAESKWGLGHHYRHSLMEVPSDYGDEIEFFEPIAADTALDELVELARENGVEFGEPGDS